MPHSEYNSYQSRYFGETPRDSDKFLLMIVEQFSDKSKPLIDVGCSTGNFLGLVKQSPKLNLMNLLGIDLSTESVAEAQKNFPEIKFSIANMLKLHQKLGFMFLGGQILSLTLVYRILTIQSLVKQ